MKNNNNILRSNHYNSFNDSLLNRSHSSNHFYYQAN